MHSIQFAGVWPLTTDPLSRLNFIVIIPVMGHIEARPSCGSMTSDRDTRRQPLSTARRYTRLAFGLGVVCVLVTVVVNAVLVPAANLHVLPRWEQRAAVVLQREVGVLGVGCQSVAVMKPREGLRMTLNVYSLPVRRCLMIPGRGHQRVPGREHEKTCVFEWIFSTQVTVPGGGWPCRCPWAASAG